jgi:hypothetical protein
MIPIFKLVFLYPFARLPNNPGLILRAAEGRVSKDGRQARSSMPSFETPASGGLLRMRSERVAAD